MNNKCMYSLPFWELFLKYDFNKALSGHDSTSQVTINSILRPEILFSWEMTIVYFPEVSFFFLKQSLKMCDELFESKNV